MPVVTSVPLPMLAWPVSPSIAIAAMDVTKSGSNDSNVSKVANRIDRPIVLVGMMGVGKSSVGKRLAAQLEFSFIDADDEIEQSAQLSIPEIFENYGEDYFRDGERRVIARLIEEGSRQKIIATGGGAFCDEQTRALILKKAIAVWLDSDIDTLVERTGRKDNRPLLKQGNPREILTRLRNERFGAYSQAPIQVTSAEGPHSHTVTKIIEGIDKWL